MSKYVVLDLEMCNVYGAPQNEGRFLRNEIIEIGAVILNEDLETVDKFVTYVKPEYGVIDDYIERLTRITPGQVEGAPSAKEALGAFASWLPDDVVAVSWSESDEHQIRNEMRYKGLEIPKLEELLDSWVDCQKTFTGKMDTTKVYNLTEALTISGIDYEDGAHDALVDACNTAMLFVKMETEPEMCLIDCYSSETDDDMRLTYNPFAEFFANIQK